MHTFAFPPMVVFLNVIALVLVSIGESILSRAWLILRWVIICQRVNHLGV